MNIDTLSINTIQLLGVDAINKANSGHPGIVLGAAPMVHTLFTRHLKINPKDPKWINRDRFILSAGHGSALLYAINHLAGYKVSIEDIKKFRQPGNTPGHPEYGHTDGVEATTGPLGQGFANGVGMALAEKHLAAVFNKQDLNIFDHYTYVLCGDGDLQEGVVLESAALAGHLQLNKLIVLFDSNDIQLDGPTSLANSDDIKKKFEAMNWQHILVKHGDNCDEIDKAIKKAKKSAHKPTIIEVKTVIGAGAAKEGSSSVHGSPLGKDDTTALKNKLNWHHPDFFVPEEVVDFYKNTTLKRGKSSYNKWNSTLKKFHKEHISDYHKFENFLRGDIFYGQFDDFNFEVGSKDATRNIAGRLLNKLAIANKNIIGGSADLTSSTKAKGNDGDFSATNPLGRNINYGVREHAMGSIANGITLHGALKTFIGGFFVFSDYMKPPIRLAALMNIPTTFIFTHDTIAVGEDGPTHQPVEQLAGLRSIPNLNVFRPADANEVKAAFHQAFSKKYPTCIILTRQNVSTLEHTSIADAQKGAYIVSKEAHKLDGILLACGSEVELAIEAQKLLLNDDIDVRVVSMPSQFLFDHQSKEYKQAILPKGIKTLAIEMGASMPWYKYSKDVFGIDEFGISAPLNEILSHFGFTKENVVKRFKLIKE